AACRTPYPKLGSIPLLVPDPEAYVSRYAHQLSRFEEQAAQTVETIQNEMGALDMAPLARERCLGMIDAVRGQTADILQIMQPLLPGPAPETGTTANEEPRGFPWPLTHTHNLFRDWGWPSDPDGENEKAVAMVEAVLQDQPLGQAIVIGAGGCRLAYDLHRHDPESEILVVDIDPLLFAVAHDVIRGGRHPLPAA